MAKDNISVSVSADWDYEDAVKKLNNGLKKIEKRLNALSIKAKIDEKTNTEIQNLIQKLNKLKKLGSQLEKKGISLNTKTDSSDKVLSELQDLRQIINEINSKSLSVDTKSTTNNIENLSDSLESVGKSADGAGNKLKNMLSDIGISVSAMQVFEMIKNTLNDITDAVKEFDKYSTEIKIVTNQPDSVVNDMLADYAETSINLGVNIDDVEKAGVAILRAGKNTEDTNKILKDSIMLSKTGFIESGAAAESLITTANAYDITADSIENINDKLLALDSNSQTTAGALSAGVAKAAANAKAAEVSLDSLASRIATIKQTTGKTELESATALNAMYSRLYNVKLNAYIDEDESGVEEVTAQINDMEKMLNTVNIKLRDSKDSFRDFDGIIKDLSLHWGEFNDTQKSAIAKTLGGTTYRSTVLALIENQKEFERLQDISSQSMGTAAEKYSAYMESLESKSNSLNTALKQMFANTIDSDFIGNVKSATTEVIRFADRYEVLKNLLKVSVVYGAAKGFLYLKGTLSDAYKSIANLSGAFNSLSTFQNATAGTAAYNTALSSLGGSMSLLTENQKKLLLSTNGLTEAQRIAILEASGMTAKEAKASLATLGLSTAENTATASTFSLSGAFKALTATMATNPIGAAATALMALMTAMSVIKNKQEEAAEQQKELERQIAENTRAFQEETDVIEGLLSKYVTLVSQNSDLSAVKKDLTEIQNQLIDTYGVEADSIDLLNGKISENIDLINQRRLAGAEKYLEDNAAQIRDAKKEKDQKQKSISSILKISDLDEHKEEIDKFALTHNMLISDAGLGGNATVYDLKRDTLDNQIQTLSEFAELLRSFGDDGYDTKYYDKIIAEKNELIQKQERINGLLEDAAENERIISELKISPELDSQLKSGLDELVEKQQELNDLRNGSTEGSIFEIKQTEDEIKSLTSSLFDMAGANTEWNDRITSTINSFETGASNAITSTVDLEKAFYESLDDMQKGSLKNIELIENAMQTLANGKYVPWKDFFDIKKLDTNDVLSIPTKIGNELNMDAKELQQLKDAYIKPIIESLQEENQSIQDQIESTNGVVNGLKDQLEYELLILDAQIAQGVNSSGDEKRLNDQKQKIQEIRDKIKGYGDQIKRNNLLIEMWNTHLGNTIDKTEMLENQMKKMQDTADNYAKAMTSKIDSVIDSHESEKDVLEKEKEVLNEQLDTLEEQQKAIEDIVDDYKSVVDMVGDVTDKEIDLLKKQQEAEENAVQAKIDALKEAREQQEEENTLAEKQLALQEKLRDLEKARQTKVRTYSSERGWHFDVDKEAVANAQTAVDDAQADYDKAVDDKAYNDQLSALEKEKDLISKNFEEQIKAYEDYYDEWKAILDEQTEAENEQIAQQILGAEWREKIKNKDTDVLNKFKSNFQGYNTQLNNLINTEIANLKLSIKAKEDEIKAKEKQIQSWKDYKTQVESSINSIKGKYEDYVEFLDKIEISENSSYEDREKALANFVDMYQGYIDEIQNIQAQLSDINVNLTLDTNFDEVRWKTAEFLTQYRDGILAMDEALRSSSTGFGVVNSSWDEELANAAKYASSINFYDIMGCAKGGVVDYTGLTMLHGEKQRPEVVFNAAQSKQLYDMVMKGEFADLAAARAAEGFTSVLKSIESAHTFNKNINNTNNSNTSSIVIHHMDINGVQNPAEFANEFNKNMKQYLQNVYVESLVK